jgi:hypothetical protein
MAPGRRTPDRTWSITVSDHLQPTMFSTMPWTVLAGRGAGISFRFFVAKMHRLVGREPSGARFSRGHPPGRLRRANPPFKETPA